jgi:hypothetical protein
VETPHLNIVKDSIGNFFVEVAQGADRIILTPPLWNLTEASDARKRIADVTGLRRWDSDERVDHLLVG